MSVAVTERRSSQQGVSGCGHREKKHRLDKALAAGQVAFGVGHPLWLWQRLSTNDRLVRKRTVLQECNFNARGPKSQPNSGKRILVCWWRWAEWHWGAILHQGGACGLESKLGGHPNRGAVGPTESCRGADDGRVDLVGVDTTLVGPTLAKMRIC